MHHNGYGVYRNTTIINSGTWQKQTDFQVKLGHVPTPGMVPVLNLKTHKITENYFYKQEES
jgi:DNA polymerase II small subunit